MFDPGVITVTGSAAESWLAACMLARFAPISPNQIRVCVVAHETGDQGAIIARPEIKRVHASLGLDLSRIGASRVQAWVGPNGDRIPFGSIGSGYKGVSFVAIWQRARALKMEPRSLLDFAATQPLGAYSVERLAYANALRAIAINVGVTEVSDVEGTCISVTPGDDVGASGSGFQIGAAALPVKLEAALGLLVLERSVRALIECWPWTSVDRALCEQEFQRIMSMIARPLEDMQALVLDGPERVVNDSFLSHRIALWRQLGRVAPIDDDLFPPQEWMAAMLNAGLFPAGGERQAQSLSVEEIKAHLEACAPRETVNAE